MKHVRAARVPLGRNGRFGYALIDAKDLERVQSHTWHRRRQRRPNGKVYYYAFARREHTRCSSVVTMHQLLLGLRRLEVDHHNGNGLDNRRRNLRPATHRQNAANRTKHLNNTTGFKGVAVVRDRKWRVYRWKAHICHAYKKEHLGCYRSPKMAARAYDRAARHYFGEFACVNFPRRGERRA